MIQVAVMGYGTIGSGVAEVLDINREGICRVVGEEISVKYILDLREFPGDRNEAKIVHDLSVITEDPEINVPILAHSDYTGAQYESEWSGLSASLIGAKLPRMAGLDMVISLSPYGKFPMLMDTFVNAGTQMLAPLEHIKPTFPMPGGGTTQGHIEDVIKKFGKDVMIAAGGAIHGHPMGPAAGARAFRQGIDAVMQGRTLEDAAKEYKELGVAVDSWGIYSEKKTGLFDLKG